MNIKKLFGKRIKEIRTRLYLTQEELAERIGISAKSLSQIELGNNFISAENLSAICSTLKINPKVLFDFQTEEEENNFEYVVSKLKENKILLNKICQIIQIIE